MRWLIRTWLPIAIAVTGLCVLIYAVVQQQYRASLNDPQIRIAEDAAAQINAGTKPASVIPQQKIDIAESLGTWVALYDKDAKPVISSGLLFNATPTPPAAAISIVHDDPGYRGQNRVTWQPYSGLRQALVVVGTQKEYIVVAGRNMKEVEERMWAMRVMVGSMWVLILAATLLASWFGARENPYR